jgi:hypothetical protein
MSDARKVEIPQTDLMNWMERLLAACAPYRRAILAGILALIVLITAYFILNQQRETAELQNWELYSQATDAGTSPEQLKKMREAAKGLGDSSAGQALRLRLAQALLGEGVEQLYVDKIEGRKMIEEAAKLFEQLSQQTSQVLLREPALLGLAQAQESLGQVPAAIKSYTALKENFRSGFYAKLAQDRLELLALPRSTEFYTWFQTAQLPDTESGLKNPFNLPNLPNLPGDSGSLLPGGLVPNKAQSLPDAENPFTKDLGLPSLKLPDPLPGTTSAAEKPNAQKPNAEAEPATTLPEKSAENSATASPSTESQPKTSSGEPGTADTIPAETTPPKTDSDKNPGKNSDEKPKENGSPAKEDSPAKESASNSNAGQAGSAPSPAGSAPSPAASEKNSAADSQPATGTAASSQQGK